MKKILKKILDWLVTKEGWLQVVNIFIVLLAYGTLDNLNSSITWLIGLWGFILLAYWIFWKGFNAEEVVKGYIKQRKKEKNKK